MAARALIRAGACALLLLHAICLTAFSSTLVHANNLVSLRGGRTRVCLNMLLNSQADEEAALQRLESALPQLDSWVICLPETPGGVGVKLSKLLLEAGLQGWAAFFNDKVKQDEAQNWCLQQALLWSRKQGELQGASQSVDYILAIAPYQQVIVSNPNFSLKTAHLAAPSYRVIVEDPVSTSPATLLISTQYPWHWHGQAFAYLRSSDAQGDAYRDREPILQGLHISDTAADQLTLERKRELLTAALEQEPSDRRSVLYLGNTYRDMFKREDAITHYLRRMQLGGDKEEVFTSALNIAMIMHRQYVEGIPVSQQVNDYTLSWSQLQPGGEKDVWRIIQAYLAASQISPQRQEPLYEVAKIYRIYLQDYESCFSYAAMAHGQGPPPPAGLFVLRHVYGYVALSEMCTCGYYTLSHFEDGMSACITLEQRLEDTLSSGPEETRHSKTGGGPRGTLLRDLLANTRTNLQCYHNKQTEDKFILALQTAHTQRNQMLGSPHLAALERAGRTRAIIAAFHEAHKILPHHVEPLYLIAHLYRTELMDYNRCSEYAVKAIQLSPAPSASSSESMDMYGYMLRSELCSCGLHSQIYFSTGLETCEKLLARIQYAVSKGSLFKDIQGILEMMRNTASTLQHYTKAQGGAAKVVVIRPPSKGS